jgi:hypothetical protein
MTAVARAIDARTWTARAPVRPAHPVDLTCLATAGSALFSAGGDPFGAAARGFVRRWDASAVATAAAAPLEPVALAQSDTYFTGACVPHGPRPTPHG